MAISPEESVAVIVTINAAIVGGTLIFTGWWFARGELSLTSPGPRQNAAETILDFFLGKARDIASGPRRERLTITITAFLTTLFCFIILSNALGVIPVPSLNRPPTSHYSATLALALVSVVGTLCISSVAMGLRRTLTHLVWPNPLQWVSEFTDVLSLSLRLFGNIAGEYMTFVLVTAAVPYGIPLILHVLGMIPIVVQALVFTLLTASFLGTAIHREHEDHTDEVVDRSTDASATPGEEVAA